MLRKLSLIALLFALTLPAARADEASKRAKIEELFTLMKLDSLMQQVLTSSMKQGEQAGRSLFGEKPVAPADQKILDAFEAKMTTLLTNTISWEKLKPAYLDLYASVYSESDVDGMVAFYRSSAGQHMIDKTPELLTASQKIVMDRMVAVQPQLQDMMKDLAAQVAAAHPEASKQ